MHSSAGEEQREARRQKDQRLRIEKDIEERNERARKHLSESSGDELPEDEPREDQEPHSTDEQTPSAAKKKRLFSVPATQLGMRVMNPGPVNPTVDIVAVHGLGAIPDITWKESKSGVNWLSDPQMLPSRTPDARILRFGYDSLWLGKEAIRTRLPTIADKLLLVLARERQQDPMRPLIFIGHCFGGLVIQRALITAKLHPESETEEAILKSTVGAVFLGTPHRGTGAFGSQSALLAAIAAQTDLYLSMESEVLDAMKVERGELLDVSEDFLKLSVRENLRITCFFEQRESNLGKMIGRDDIKQFVVDETSAKLGANRAIGLPTDHFKLNKFAAPEDGNYLDVAGEVSRLYTEALKLASERCSSKSDSAGDLEQYRRLIAKQELKLEEAAKEAALKEEEFERRFQEKLEENVLLPKDDVRTGKQQVERLKRNMRRYGLGKRAVRSILQDNPTPSTEDSSHDNMQERDQWYQNSLKGSLFEAGLEEGEVDAIIHDTGETMVVEGVRTSVTRMSERWLDERTLRRYDIPFMRDPAQSPIHFNY
ncbi:hypothetical protein SLS63_001936 [Diaporthe eres]|uniref:DUF676 domain-containing protein n=1 Tax=Diaporthe eres TaxID=83184 RepID=A0ABR1PLR2_DIAER